MNDITRASKELCDCCESRPGRRCCWDEITSLRGQLEAAEQHVKVLRENLAAHKPGCAISSYLRGAERVTCDCGGATHEPPASLGDRAHTLIMEAVACINRRLPVTLDTYNDMRQYLVDYADAAIAAPSQPPRADRDEKDLAELRPCYSIDGLTAFIAKHFPLMELSERAAQPPPAVPVTITSEQCPACGGAAVNIVRPAHQPPAAEREIPMGSRVRGVLSTHITGTVAAIDTRYEIEGDNGEFWTAWHRELEVTSPTKPAARDPRCDCQNPEPARGPAMRSMTCPIHNDLPADSALGERDE